MVAERVVDVLEMIKINVKHRGGWAAVADLGNSAFEPLSEINAVGQSAKGIAQRKSRNCRSLTAIAAAVRRI